MRVTLKRSKYDEVIFSLPKEVKFNYTHHNTNDPNLWKREAELLMNFPFSLSSNESLMKVVSITTPDGKTRLVFCFHQIIVDELSITSIINDIFDFYLKRCMNIPSSSHDPQPSVADINSIIPKEEVESFWPFKFWHYIRKFKKWDRPKVTLDVPNYQTTTTSMFFVVPRSKTIDLRRSCMKNGVEFNGFVSAAILAAIKSSIHGKEKSDTVSLLCQNTFDMRGSFNPPIVGRFTAPITVDYVYDIEIRGSDTLWGLSKRLDKMYSDFLCSGDTFKSWLLYPTLNQEKFTKKASNLLPSVHIYPVGSIDLHPLVKNELKLDSSELIIMRSNLTRAFNVIIYDVDGRLHMTITFQQPIFDEKSALEFYSNLRTMLLREKVDVDAVLSSQ